MAPKRMVHIPRSVRGAQKTLRKPASVPGIPTSVYPPRLIIAAFTGVTRSSVLEPRGKDTLLPLLDWTHAVQYQTPAHQMRGAPEAGMFVCLQGSSFRQGSASVRSGEEAPRGGSWEQGSVVCSQGSSLPTP